MIFVERLLYIILNKFTQMDSRQSDINNNIYSLGSLVGCDESFNSCSLSHLFIKIIYLN